ncbi:MAG TPA: DegV family protein [Dehalococcoidia bacterium]|nr:DegV family protein [Dehalococcoidia bacterium]
MAIKIVTDSTSDIPHALAEKYGITVVPVYVQFGNKTYRDRIDITESEFYERLLHFPVHPTTSQPSPQDFVDVYKNLSEDADGIISIHIAGKLSGTYNSAICAKDMVTSGCPIEVIDTNSLSMGLGLIVLKAAQIAASCNDFQQTIRQVKQLIERTHILIVFDTLKYLAMGGRIGKGKALLGNVLNIKPLLTLKDGEFLPAAKARSREKAIDILYSYAEKAGTIDDISVIYSTTLGEAEALAQRLEPLCGKKATIARVGPALGVHAGPGALALAILTTE